MRNHSRLMTQALSLLLLATSVEGYSVSSAGARVGVFTSLSAGRPATYNNLFPPIQTSSTPSSPTATTSWQHPPLTTRSRPQALPALSSPLFLSRLHQSRRGVSDETSANRPTTTLSVLKAVVVRVVSKIAPFLVRWRKYGPKHLRRSFMIVCASLFLWMSAAGIQAPPSHASSSATAAATASSTTTSTTSILLNKASSLVNPSLDTIVDGYVRNHLFDDDVYDPVESLYREAMDDKLQGTYPKALKEISGPILKGTDVVQKAAKAEGGMSIGSILARGVGFLQMNVGLSEMQAVMLLTGALVVGTPAFLLSVAMYVGMQNKRGMNRLMKKRYGESYTTDATIKVEEDVELPNDDDDDDDDEDDE